jgi:polysaccharide export outer membrane protein
MEGTRARANKVSFSFGFKAPRGLCSALSSSLVALTALALASAGCGTTAPFVWVDAVPATAEAATDVVIRDGDTITVRVFNQDPLSTKEKVRPDGKIVIPAVGEIMVRGKKPAQLGKEVEDKLKAILQAPSVTISVEQNTQMNVSVVGEVKNSGIFQLEPTANVLTAVAAAGGLTDYADGEKIFVIRKGMPQRVRFKWNDLRGAESHAVGFVLRPGDTVVVE